MSIESGPNQEFINFPLLQPAEKPLAGKTALITGGTRPNGIGFAIAERFALEGAGKLVLVGTENSYGNKDMLEARLDRYGTKALVIACDITSETEVSETMERAYEYCDGNVDILVNNAGTNINKAFTETSAEDWKRIVEPKGLGAFLMSRAWFSRRDAAGIRGGRVINMASVIGGSHGFYGNAPYSEANAAIIGLTKSSALDMGRNGINVNAIAPTFIPGTDLTSELESFVESVRAVTPLKEIKGREGVKTTPEDIAAVALFLAGPDSAKISGQIITVDGAMGSNFTAFDGLFKAGFRKVPRAALSLVEDLTSEEIAAIKQMRKSQAS